jgi:hypothetical protein
MSGAPLVETVSRDVDDPFFGPPYIDEDGWEDTGVRHRYVHGGFEGTDTRFAFCFPEAEHYSGRFVQFLEGGPGGHEGKEAHPDEFVAHFLELATSLGAYFIECNTGHIGADQGPDDRTISAFRANAQSARYARVLAEEMYGSAPHHGYLLGGSSGGLRAIFGLEHVYDVWDGAVPFVVGPLTSFTVGYSMPLPRMVNAGGTLALLSPESKKAVLDGAEPGGGDPLSGLDQVEREAVDALFKSGFQRQGLFQYAGQSTLALIVPTWIMMPFARDPRYLEDFWTVPGYAGADGELALKLIDAKATVTKILTVDELIASGITEHPLAVTFGATAYGMADMGRGLVSQDGWPADSLLAHLVVRSGKAVGSELTCWGTFGDVLVVGGGAELAPGDEVTIDNRRFLAAALYYRYQSKREAAGLDGMMRSGQTSAGYLPTGMSGRFFGKMIMFNATLDVMAPTGGAVLYDEMVHEAYGHEVHSKFRLWWVDNSCHTGLPMGPLGPPALESRAVTYGGVMQEALRSVIEWVEEGVDPAPSTAYRVEDGQVVLAPSAAERQGVQPVATATVNGAVRAEVRAGSPVSFEVRAEAPPRGGTIIGVAWDFDGSGKFAFEHDGIDGSSASVKLATTHTFDTPGTYFPAVRVVSERDGKLDARLFRIENLDRVRIVVT